MCLFSGLILPACFLIVIRGLSAARLEYSQRLLAVSQETSWLAAFRWIWETPGSFLQAQKPNLVSIAKAALLSGGIH